MNRTTPHHDQLLNLNPFVRLENDHPFTQLGYYLSSGGNGRLAGFH
jgi:hypothetical protein